MKRKILLSLSITVILAAFIIPIPNTAQAMTGAGTEVDPYMIYDVNDLQDMADNLSAYYELANDIDASATSGWNGGAGFIPVGNSTSPFTGNFDGGNFTISGLFINRPTVSRVGLFGFTKDATIVDANMYSANITGDDRVGSLIGEATGNLTVTNCSSMWGNVLGDFAVGGLIGHWYGSLQSVCSANISDSHTTMDVYGVDVVGGFIGEMGTYVSGCDNAACRPIYNAEVRNCYSSGDTYLYSDGSDGSWIGGFVGYLYGSDDRLSSNSTEIYIHNCYSFGNVNVADELTDSQGIGGFLGFYHNTGDYNYITIEDCCSSVDITVEETDDCMNIGGFVGGGSMTGTPCLTQFTRCYATGDVLVVGTDGHGKNDILNTGGFAGSVTCGGEDLFCVGDVHIEGDYGGGFAGQIGSANGSTLKNCYTSSSVYVDSILDVTTDELGGFAGGFWYTEPQHEAIFYDINIISNKTGSATDDSHIQGFAELSSFEARQAMAIAGFDFSDTGDWTNDSLINNGNPYLKNGVCSLETSEFFDNPATAPDYVIDCPTCTDNLTSSGNFTSNETFTGGPPGFAVVDDAASESGAPPIWLWGWIGMFAIIAPGFFITYMERKFGSGNGNLLLRMVIALIVIGLLVTWGRFDWWMIVFYIIIAAASALMSRQYDIGGAGGISQYGWIGFCATSWIGLTIINRILEGQFLTSSESSWWCSIQLFNEFRVFDLFTLPVLNFQFFTVGIPSLLRWDYSFFGGNAELIQYLLYTITAVVAFILFCIMVGLLFNAFKAR